MVPEGWKKVPLKTIAEVRSGVAKGKSGLKDPITVQYLRVANVQDGHINLNDVKDIQIERHQLERYSLKFGDVLMNEGGDFDKLGRGDVWQAQIKPCLHQNHVFAVRPIPQEMDSFYLAALAASSYGKKYFLSCAKRSTNLASINSTQLKEFPVLVPPLPEQKKIAKILSAWDKAIATSEQLLANSQQQKKALMQQLLNGHTRLPGFSDRWMGGVLGDIATIDSGFTFKSNTFINTDNGIPVIRMNNLKNGRLDISDSVKISPEITKGLEKFSLLENDFLFGMSGSLNNYAWVTAKDLPCYLNQRVGRITAKNNHDQTFLTYLYLSDKVQKSILDKAEGAAQLNISINELRETPINYPAPKEQKKIAEILLSADNHITKLQQKLYYLKQEKKALMQQLLTGKRRVKVDAA
ncbi:restriction endonuclease subunit S [Yersinia similis]|uniref:Restriction modification enzyme n=1 Tax=Yersinia similis TaxID=367190 RepID=A0A0T9QBU4_9GAMM|nr:restriction endonuclease subunit S [Yersinia similis]CNG57166.1 restriction modification enzyme [Yersinia similis]CNI04798.1 restriction modification enzyme [Yersinia similis]